MSGTLRPSHEIPGPILVVAAHPDDIEVHCGGTLAHLVAQGTRVTYVLCTSGNRGAADPEVTMDEIGATREGEQQAASDILGVTDVRFLRHDDGDLAFIVRELREEIVRLVRETSLARSSPTTPIPGTADRTVARSIRITRRWGW